MTEDEIIRLVSDLPGVIVVQTATEANGAPEIAWGDTFIYYDPDNDPASRMMPFATVATKGYPGFDTESDLNRPGAFRLNDNVGRSSFDELIGYQPAAHPDHHAEWAYTTLDTILPHPVYAERGWVSIVCPGAGTTAQVRTLLENAHARAAQRYRARS